MARPADDDVPSANGRGDAHDLEAIEREHVEQLARAHAAIAAAQDRSYWLDRWGVDLNGLMRRPGARWVRWLLRCLRELQRTRDSLRRYTALRLSDLRATAVEDDLAAASERERAASAGSGDDDPSTARG